MPRKKRFSALIVLVTLCLCVLCLSGCATAQAEIGRDGSGTITLAIDKSDGTTEQDVRERMNDIFEGVSEMSGDEYRLKLKSLKERADGFVVKISFKRIQYTKGLGDFDYMKSRDFLAEENKIAQVTNWARGRFKRYQSYSGDLYIFDGETLGNPQYAFRPTLVSTGETVSTDDFLASGGVMDRKKGQIFSFFMADFAGLQSITFSFAGKITAYGSKNIEQVDKNTVRVYPTNISAVVTTLESAERKDVSCFAGYVVFDMGMNKILLGCLIGGGALLGGFVIYGFVSGLFKRIHRSRKARLLRKNYSLYLMMLPAIALLILFSYLPMGGVVMAFKNFRINDGIYGSEWAAFGGFKNFVDLFVNPASDFLKLAKNTVILAVLKFIFGFVCSIGLAILFSYLANGIFKKTVQTISYFPYFISWVVVYNIAYLFLASDGGIFNRIIERFGGTGITWYSSPQYWRSILTISSIWKTVGYSTIVYLAGMTAIDPGLYEAAKIDGAGRCKQLWHITLPGLFPVIGIQIIFSLGNLVKDDFDQIYTMVGGNNAALSETTDVIGTIVFKSIGSVSAYSSAAAMSLLQSTVALVIVLFSNKLIKKLNMEGIF